MKAELQSPNLIIFQEEIYLLEAEMEGIVKTGDFAKKILILNLSDDWNEPNQQLFGKICDAISIDPSDFYQISIEKIEQAVPLINRYKPNTVLLFDIPLSLLELPENRNIHFCQTDFLKTSSLSVLSQNSQVKVAFWNALKTLFSA